MALLFLEGFEGYNSTGEMQQQNASPCKWNTFYNSGSTFTLNAATYRTTQVTAANSRSLYLSCGSDYSYAFLNVPSSTELIVGLAFYKNTASYFNGSLICFGGTTTQSQGTVIAVNQSNQLFASTATSYAGPNTTLGIASVTVNNYTWHYLEARVKLGAATGQVEVYLDGVQVMNLNNVNTATGGITSFQTVGLGGVYNNYMYAFFDDMYICDTTGTTNNTFLGPISVYSLMPTANGSLNQFTPTGAASNWDCVNEGVSNTTDYVASSVTGQKDYYTFESLPGTVTTVAGVHIKARSTLPTAGTRKIKFNLKNGASVLSSALKSLVLGTWLTDGYVSDTAPDGTAWTPAKVNSTEGGIETG